MRRRVNEEKFLELFREMAGDPLEVCMGVMGWRFVV
jgi:hypothetical protein